ncbi:hypothetical protein [Halobellus rufus]|uniref:hypothetical protein n=1 Tax=Halobellus rufus TaxID=1448860 RepID=UPI000679D91A|nr:hypothetical protein [Halobellus rufus]
MGLHLTRAFGDGIKRVLTRTGAILFGTLLLIQFLVQASVNTAVLGFVPPEASGQIGSLGLTLPVSGSVGAALLLVALVATSIYFVALARALTRPTGELSTLPETLYRRRLGRATISMLLGGLVVGISVSIGLAFVLLPGIFLSACFLCFIFAVGVEDRGPISALRRSWDLSRGNRLKLSVIVVLSGVIGAVIGVVGTVFDLVGAAVLGEVLTIVIGSVLFIFLYGVMAASYLQLRDATDDRSEPEGAEFAERGADSE